MSIQPLCDRNSVSPSTPVPTRSASAVSVVMPTRPRYLWAVGFAGLVIAALMASRAAGQAANFQYESIPMHPALQDEAAAKRVQAVTKQFANSGQGNAASVNGYYAYYVPAKMTAPDGVLHISELMDEATTLLGRAERSNRQAVVNTLSRYIREGMTKVVQGNHHPAARINAILMLSRLNSRPANLQNRTPPVPDASVLPILLAQYQDQNNVDGVRAAALHGIHRHVLYGFPQISQQDQATISQLATDLLDSPAPLGRSEEAHAYLQRFAIDILDVLKPEDDKQLATKLVSISTEPSKPDLIALYSAARLGRMSSDLQGQVDQPEDLLKSWTKRILDAYEEDLARITGMERKMSSVSQPPKPEVFLEVRVSSEATRERGAMDMDSMMDQDMDSMMEGMMGMENYDEMGGMEMDMEGMMEGMMGGMMGALPEAKPQPPEVRVSRSKLNSVLQQVHLGVSGRPAVGVPTSNPGGLLASVPEEKKPVVEQWLTDMEAIVTELNKAEHDNREKWLEVLTEQVATLKEMVGEEDAADPLLDLQDDLGADPLNDLGLNN